MNPKIGANAAKSHPHISPLPDRRRTGGGLAASPGANSVHPPRRSFLRTVSLAGPAVLAGGCAFSKPTAVLTFDDAVRSDRDFVAPVLADLGFSATFFVTHRWMDDRANFMSWDEIAEIAEMGFEIGNHSWSHADFSKPKNAARLEGELALVENALERVGVARPVSFAWCGNHFGPEAWRKLRDLGYRFARRGLSPELDDRALEPGPAYDPDRYDRLLIPTTGNAVPGWTLDLFRRILDRAAHGVVVLQFHGVPDIAHPWVHTTPQSFRDYMLELKRQDFEVLALRDLGRQVPDEPVDDPHVTLRNPPVAESELEQPVELVQTRADLKRWTDVMLRHRYTVREASAVGGFSEEERAEYQRRSASWRKPEPGPVEIRPYPGGRHPRMGFLEGAIDPLRGTKASVFLPWDPESYVVVDLPELITSQLGHLFLAHTHVPTLWSDLNIWLDNVDRHLTADGGLAVTWTLPNRVSFGSAMRVEGAAVALDLWLYNGLDQTLSGLRTQLCVMLKGALGFEAQTLANKLFDPPVAGVRSEGGDRWILTAWDRAGRCWGSPRCPCLHSDPVFPDCKPGQTVRLSGRLWFHEGGSIAGELAEAKRAYWALPGALPQA